MPRARRLVRVAPHFCGATRRKGARMARQEPERQFDEQPEELSDADLEAENAAELPDREAMSLVSPDGGLVTRAEWVYLPGPLPHDGPTPVPIPTEPRS